MKEYVNVIHESFVDFAGKTHYFTIAAVTTRSDRYSVYDYQEEDEGDLKKDVRLGISICNPIDKFDKEIGVRKAVNRAKKNDPILYSSGSGFINETLVNTLLYSEAEYVKNHPNSFIKGYKDAEQRYLQNKKMEELAINFTDIEKDIVEEVKKNPSFLDRVTKYLTWYKRH